MQELAQRFSCNRKTIARYLKQAQLREPEQRHFSSVNIIMDTTYFGRKFGVMVLYDSISRQALSVSEVKSESNALYRQAIRELQEKGIHIQSIICDGRRGLTSLFPDIPIQLCQFHQVKTINRYLTRKPQTAAAVDLKQLALSLKNSSKAAFEEHLNNWHKQHKDFLNERSSNPETGKSHYRHKRLRNAYNSLRRNLHWLFTFEDYPELNLPKTTNLLEGKFGDLKRLLACHCGMGKDNKVKFIKDYFA